MRQSIFLKFKIYAYKYFCFEPLYLQEIEKSKIRKLPHMEKVPLLLHRGVPVFLWILSKHFPQIA